MKPTWIFALAAVALLSAASAASATTIAYDYPGLNPGVATTSAAPVVNVYSLDPLTVSTSPTSLGSTFAVVDPDASGTSESFVSDFVFDVASVDDVGASANFTFIPGKIGVSAYSLALYWGTPGGASALVPTTTVTDVGQSSYDAILAPGDYFVQTDVTVPADVSGKYQVQVVASAVSAAPEPAVWVLMFAGVAMTGGLLRFRRSAGASPSLA